MYVWDETASFPNLMVSKEIGMIRSCENRAAEDEAEDAGRFKGVHGTHGSVSHFANPESELVKLCKHIGHEYLLPSMLRM